MSDRLPAFTVLGSSGFIGSAVVDWLKSQDYPVHAITRASFSALLSSRRPVGHVIDCIGLTGDFGSRPIDTADAHVGLVARCLGELSFDSFLLLSSTRVYASAASTNEDAPLPCRSYVPSELYNLTKLAGEALCLADPRPSIRVARVSNVYGVGMSAATFLGDVLREGHRTGCVTLRQSGASAKDYVSVGAIVRLLPAIAVHGRARLYNLAAGFNTSNNDIAEGMRELLGWQVQFADAAPTVGFLPIDTARADAEFGPTLSRLSADLPTLLSSGQEIYAHHR